MNYQYICAKKRLQYVNSKNELGLIYWKDRFFFCYGNESTFLNLWVIKYKASVETM